MFAGAARIPVIEFSARAHRACRKKNRKNSLLRHQNLAASASIPVKKKCRPRDHMPSMKVIKPDTDQHCVAAMSILDLRVGAERARNRDSHATAHRVRRTSSWSDHNGNTRDMRRIDSTPTGRLRGLAMTRRCGADRDHVGPGQPQQLCAIGAVDQRVSYRRLGGGSGRSSSSNRYFRRTSDS